MFSQVSNQSNTSSDQLTDNSNHNQQEVFVNPIQIDTTQLQNQLEHICQQIESTSKNSASIIQFQENLYEILNDNPSAELIEAYVKIQFTTNSKFLKQILSSRLSFYVKKRWNCWYKTLAEFAQGKTKELQLKCNLALLEDKEVRVLFTQLIDLYCDLVTNFYNQYIMASLIDNDIEEFTLHQELAIKIIGVRIWRTQVKFFI